MPWFKVDDKLHDHRKARQARKAAMGVWVLAGSWCADNNTGGFVPASILPRWGNVRDAEILVGVGLWHPETQDGEDGWRFHEWDIRNPDTASVNAKRDAESAGGVLGNHKRWHEKRKVLVPDCPFCQPDSGTRSGDIGVPESGANPPVPSRPLTVVTSPVSPKSVAREVDGDGLTRIRQALNGCPEAHARKTAAFVLAKAPADVRNPTAYVLAAIADEPEAYRYRRGNPKKSDECPTHAGQWADHCAGCAADRKAGNA